MSGSNSSSPESLSPVALTVHDVATPDAREAQRRTVFGRIKMLAVLAVCAAPVLASYFTYYVIRPEGRTNYGALIQPSRTMPALALTDLDGRAVDAAALRGQWLLVHVGPAACDAACEKRLFMQRQLREMVGRERERIDKVWLVTDAAPLAPALRSALEAAPAARLLRADAAAVAGWLAPEPGRRIGEHLYLVDPLGEWMLRWPADAEPGRVKRDLERVLRATASWQRR
jgi:hypothetical protein